MKRLGVALIFILLFIFSFLSFRWIKHRMDYAISDAVFVKSDSMANLAFQVNGKVVEVYKDMGDRVKEGEPLAKLEDEDYKLMVKALEDRIKAIQEDAQALRVQREKLSKQLDYRVDALGDSIMELRERQRAMESQKQELKIQLQQVERDRERLKRLLEEGLIPKQRYEEIDTQYKSLLARLQSMEASIKEVNIAVLRAQKEYGIAKAEKLSLLELDRKIEAMEKQREELFSQLEKAKLDLERTSLYSPFDGLVAKRFVSVGDIVKAGQPAFSVIKDSSMYVEVLLEETKLRGVKVGSKAYIKLDAYPKKVFEGVVEEISPASAATFALVPRDVSAGEFTKVVQRIPVKIRITKGDISLLRVGMGGRVEIKRE
ncbi:MAG: HlyD family efflux transporter periplasmic adaptor subunit [Aquificaceae bacterium]